MRLSDMLMAFPGSIFTIALVSFLGTGLPNLILAMTITGWTYYARISRSLVLSIKNNTYIEQARLGGANNFRIMTGYIIPNVMPFAVSKYYSRILEVNFWTWQVFPCWGLVPSHLHRSGDICCLREKTICIRHPGGLWHLVLLF